MKSRIPDSLLVGLAHFVFLAFVWSLLPPSVKDSRSNDYLNRSEPVARNFIEGRGFRENNGDLMTRYPPGHPLYLIGVFKMADWLGVSEPLFMSLLALACQALVGAILYILAAEVWSRRIAVAISVLWLTYLPPLYLSIQGNNEIPYTPVFLFSVLVVWKAFQSKSGGLFFLAGLLLGIGMLIRPFAIGLPAFLVLLCLTRYGAEKLGRRVLLAGLLVAGTVVAIAPWQWYTYKNTERVYLISSVGVHGVMDGLTYGVPRPKRITLEMPPGVLKLQQSAFDNWQNKNIADFGGLLAWVRTDAAKQPWDMLSIIGRKAVRTWYATDSHRHDFKLLFLQVPYLILFGLGAIACIRAGGNAQRMAILVLVIVLFYWAMTVAGLSIMRYIVPVMPLMLLLTAPIIESCLDRCGWLPRAGEALDTIED